MCRVYTVGISKDYFGARKASGMTEFQELVKVSASSRREAAELAWSRHGLTWLRAMPSKVTTIRKISLHVNEPGIRARGRLGRLTPIEVYQE